MKVKPIYFLIAAVFVLVCVVVECVSVPVYQKSACKDQIEKSVSGVVESSKPESSPFGGQVWVIRISGSNSSWVWKVGLNVYRARAIVAGSRISKRAGESIVTIDSSVVRDLFECASDN